MNQVVNNIKQRLSLREPLAEALEVVAKLTDKLALKKPAAEEEYEAYLKEQLKVAQEVCPFCKNFERDFPSFAFSIATGIGKTRLMAACIAYLYLKKGIRHFFILAPNLTLYEKLIRDFGDTSYEKYVFKGLSEFVHNTPVVITGENYNSAHGLFSAQEIQINIFNIAKFNSENRGGAPRMRRLAECLGQSYFDYLASLDDLVILMDEAHRYHADASKRAINELRPILGLEMTATPTDEKGKSFKNIVYEYNLAQALDDGKYVKIPTVARRKNFSKGTMSDEELDVLKIEDAINIHERTKVQLELYARNTNQQLVKPFILVVCKNIGHAERTKILIEEELFDGRYAGKVLQIDSSTKKDEDIEKLFVSLENTDNQIEIVIHVNMLKEGWDVKNLYTIVPLRAADAPILVEQSIGRGLRLPYGGKRTGDPDVDKLTVIAHENFEAVIAKAQDPSSVLSKYSYIELEEDDYSAEPSHVSPVQTIIEVQQKKAIEAARTVIEKQEAKQKYDAIRAVSDMIPIANTQVKNISELAKPEVKAFIRSHAIAAIKEKAKQSDPLFAEQIAAEQIAHIDEVVDEAINTFIDATIEIPRMTVQKEVFKAEYQWFDLDTRIGFDLPALQDELIRVSIGAGEQSVETIQIQSGRKFDKPINVIVNALIDYDDIDYDENSELLYHLAGQALEAISANLEDKDTLAKVIHDFKKAIASSIYDQMKRHFVMQSTGYVKPKVLPFTGIVPQNVKEIEGYGRINYQTVIAPSHLRKFIFTGYLKSYYAEYKFDSKTEHDFSFVLENDKKVLRWLRPAREQFSIYWSNGSKRYEPDFIVETAEAIYMVETKAATNVSTDEVQQKKAAAEEYCRHASEFTAENGGKPWRYILLPHDTVDRTASFEYLIATH
ncbi:MAG: DEAD/DEAH box helicase family protein [Alistipes sp.]|nr:DEAD/DEAH box helicase family protein [Alistipes sp.]MBP3601309.1 DEAD/DEAH box helicase family protein [Alistipes sp.]